MFAKLKNTFASRELKELLSQTDPGIVAAKLAAEPDLIAPYGAAADSAQIHRLLRENALFEDPNLWLLFIPHVVRSGSYRHPKKAIPAREIYPVLRPLLPKVKELRLAIWQHSSNLRVDGATESGQLKMVAIFMSITWCWMMLNSVLSWPIPKCQPGLMKTNRSRFPAWRFEQRLQKVNDSIKPNKADRSKRKSYRQQCCQCCTHSYASSLQLAAASMLVGKSSDSTLQPAQVG